VDSDTESLAEGEFFMVFETFGPIDINLFAFSINNKCDAYVFWFPSLIAIGAFPLMERVKFLCISSFYFVISSSQEAGTIGRRAR